MTGSFYHTVSLNYQDDASITILDTSFSSFQQTAISAEADKSVRTFLYITNVHFQKCVSSTSSGCIFTTFSELNITKSCADSCVSEKRGHFLISSDNANVYLTNTFIHRCPYYSSSPSAVVGKSTITDSSISLSTINVSNCHVSQSDDVKNTIATFELEIPKFSAIDTVVYNNSGLCIIYSVRTSSFFVTNSYFSENKAHDYGVILFENFSFIFIESYFSNNGTPTLVGDLENNPNASVIIQCAVDSPAVTELEKLGFGFGASSVPMYTYINQKPNYECYIPDKYQRPKEVITVIAVCVSVICIITIVSIFGISCDLRRTYKRISETTTDHIPVVLI